MSRSLVARDISKKNPEAEFTTLLATGYEESLREQQTQVQLLKDCLKLVQDELIQLAEVRRKEFVTGCR
jgi:hypothetical protein